MSSALFLATVMQLRCMLLTNRMFCCWQVAFSPVEVGAEHSVTVLQEGQGLPLLVEGSSMVQLGPSLPRNLRPRQGLHPSSLHHPQGPAPQGLPLPVEASLTMLWVHSLPTDLPPPTGRAPGGLRLPLLVPHQASACTMLPGPKENILHQPQM